ncbi:MAG TPA: hypothetical protein ENG22_00050 [Candidatus Bathyarchaeota archaeon]|nr:hypothetical protein [Candidatus Bathyarchaeota archaeon]
MLCKDVYELQDTRLAKRFQDEVLESLVEGYYKVDAWGQIGEIKNIEDFRCKVGVHTYDDLRKYIGKVIRGEYRVLLKEPPIFFGLTFGSTGKRKVIPFTGAYIHKLGKVFERAIIEVLERAKLSHVLNGFCLNLNLPSRVKDVNGVPMGFVSGLNALTVEERFHFKLAPSQREIDSIEPKLGRDSWMKKYSLVTEKYLGHDIRYTFGIPRFLLELGKYMRRNVGWKPSELWNIEVMFLSGVAGIYSKYAERLKYMYGKAKLYEVYGATEGLFAQQIDDRHALTFNFDMYLFEVKKGKKFKMLYELRRGEWGELVVSTDIFPRYLIGDLVTCIKPGLYRVYGRTHKRNLLKLYALDVFEAILSLL